MKSCLRAVVLLFSFCVLASAAERKYEADIRRFELSDATNPPPRNAILAVGSSSMRLWTNIAESFPRHAIISRGFGGSHLSDVVIYAPRIVLPCSPRIILLYAGDNDIKDGKQPEEVAADFDAFVKIVRSTLPNTRIGYLAIKPSPAREGLMPAMRRANELIRRRTMADPTLFFVDVFSPMLNRRGEPDPRLFEADGLHPNTRGYRIWAARIKPFLKDKSKPGRPYTAS
jgi:lysophospholipase L1-like esterase